LAIDFGDCSKFPQFLPLGNKMRIKTKTQFLSSLLVLDEQSGRPKLHLALFSKKDFWGYFSFTDFGDDFT